MSEKEFGNRPIIGHDNGTDVVGLHAKLLPYWVNKFRYPVYDLEDFVRPPLDIGIPRFERIVDVGYLRKFTVENKLKTFEPETIFNMEVMKMVMPESLIEEVRIKPKEWFGGLKIAHIHLDGKIFLMEDKQWNKLSLVFKEGLENKVNQASTIPFEQARGMAKIMNNI